MTRTDGDKMPEFEYKQRPTTREYLENWDRIFKALEAPAEVQAPAQVPAPTPYLSLLDGDTGRPHFFTAGESRVIDAVWGHNGR